MKKRIYLLMTLLPSSLFAMNLQQYLDQVKNKNDLFKAHVIQLEASENKIDSAGIDLSPVLSLGYNNVHDKSLPSQMGNDREINQYTVGLAKKFITGTSVKLSGELYDYENPGAMIPGYDKYATGAVGISLSQSLWKDSFGYGTRKKIARETSAAELEKKVSELQKRAFLIQMEADYWDYAVAVEDVKLKKSNLERAEKLLKWTINRVSNGINDRSDLMNFKALAAGRKVQLLTAEDDLKIAETKMRQNLNLNETDPLPTIQFSANDFKNSAHKIKPNSTARSLEAEIARLEAETKKNVSEEVTDSLRPDLSLVGSYSTTSYEREKNDALSKSTDSDYPKSALGVQFSWVIENSSKSGLRNSALKEAMASKLKFERKNKDSQISWSELVRKYNTLEQNVKTLEEVAEYQRERVKSEQDKFLKGRTVTLSVVTAESDAAESEVTLLKAKAGLKKLESSSQLYILENEE